MPNTYQHTEHLAGLIEKKHAVLKELRDKSRRQAELIRQREMTQLMSVLSAKQNLLGELQQLEIQLDPFRDEEPDGRVWSSTDRRLEIRHVAEACDSLLQEALLLDKQSESLMKQTRDEAASQLDVIRSAGDASGAYSARDSKSGGSQIDLTS